MVVLSICSAVGQLFIYHTIDVFGPVVFTIIMTVRQVSASNTIQYTHTHTHTQCILTCCRLLPSCFPASSINTAFRCWASLECSSFFWPSFCACTVIRNCGRNESVPRRTSPEQLCNYRAVLFITTLRLILVKFAKLIPS